MVRKLTPNTLIATSTTTISPPDNLEVNVYTGLYISWGGARSHGGD